MATRESGGQQSNQSRTEKEDGPPPEPSPEAAARQEKISEDVDDVLDEIDKVLEANAEEFVRGYVQKGGQ